MKKLLAVSAALLSAVSLLLAAPVGIVDFENFSNSLIYTNSIHNGPATGLISGDHAYYFALLLAPPSQTTVDSSLSGWGFEDYGYSTTTPGLMNGNYTSDPGVDVGWPAGLSCNFVVVGWSANIGTTWGAASAWWNNGNPNSGPSGYFTISSVAQDVLVGGGLYPVPTIFGPTAGGEVQGFTLNYYSVPEPSTFSLACLAAMLSLFRFFRFAVPNKTNKINHI